MSYVYYKQNTNYIIMQTISISYKIIKIHTTKPHDEHHFLSDLMFAEFIAK